MQLIINGLTNDVLFFFFIPWNVPFKSICIYLWERLVLCRNWSIDLQSKFIGWFLYRLGFCWGYFWTDCNIILISEAAIAKYPFVFYNCGDFILGGFSTFRPYFYLRAHLWVFLYFLSVLILQKYTLMISSAECVFYY